MNRIALQLLKEFSFPFIVASVWTLFNFRASGATAASLIGNFSTAFFFISWLTGQFFRVSKQVKTENSLGSIGSRLERVTDQIAESARVSLGWSTGGDSYAYFICTFSQNEGPPDSLSVLTVGEFPLHKTSARIADLEALAAYGGRLPNINAANKIVRLGELDANRAFMDVAKLPLANTDGDRRFNIFFSARNGDWIQKLRLRRRDGAWHIASRVERLEGEQYVVLKEEGVEGFPDPETINWA